MGAAEYRCGVKAPQIAPKQQLPICQLGAPARESTWLLQQRLTGVAGDRLLDRSNRALFAAAYDGPLRRSELASLQAGELFEDVQGDATLLMPRSKTDGEGRGAIVWVAPDTVA